MTPEQEKRFNQLCWCGLYRQTDDPTGLYDDDVEDEVKAFIVSLLKGERESLESQYSKDFLAWRQSGLINYTKEEVEKVRKEERAKIAKQVGMLRQWLNEDRITDPENMVKNKDLLWWLYPDTHQTDDKVI